LIPSGGKGRGPDRWRGMEMDGWMDGWMDAFPLPSGQVAVPRGKGRREGSRSTAWCRTADPIDGWTDRRRPAIQTPRAVPEFVWETSKICEKIGTGGGVRPPKPPRRRVRRVVPARPPSRTAPRTGWYRVPDNLDMSRIYLAPRSRRYPHNTVPAPGHTLQVPHLPTP
jgi:hypothetical protein